jgi:hypothetical protein
LPAKRTFAQAEAMLVPLTRDDDRAIAAAAWAWVGVARVGQGDRAGGIAAARQALAINPDEDVARYALKVAGEAK